MKKTMTMISKPQRLMATLLLLTSLNAAAQTEVTAGVMRGKDYGVTYMLPKTEIEISLQITKHIYTPGRFCQYASRYLQLNNVSGEPETHWTLDNIQMNTVGIPDRENVYFVKLKDKTVAPLMELTEDGIVYSINMPFSGRKTTRPDTEANTRKKSQPDPSQFLTEDILMASSTAKMAELVAKEIYNIRESRNALLRGETDTPPQDGNQLKLMLDNLQLQDEVLTEMFKGKAEKDTQTIRLRITPEEMKDRVVFRFSQKLGLLDKDDLAGEPYYLNITNLQTPAIPAATEEDKKKELEGVAYNVPGRARIVLMQGNRTLTETELPVTQFGTREYLAPVLFNKNSTTKVLFDTATGGLIKVDREQ